MNDTFGMKFLWRLFSISGPNITSSPGMTTKTESSANKIALIRQMPMSGPILNCMNSIAARPPIVVSELAPISKMALLSATIAASRMSCVCLSSLKRLLKMTA